ncbi:hypothetical protein SELMODRAFT_228272 [Selaginella moellendorffii]|uniref:Nucleoside diphosphate kinase n=1 Tax=Selaginella moellendorffii TaxID=88036 RepID=D8RUJ7_SELML|nr:nucleoside diphosphate kinase 3 [Selaginella moellendorffii]EFJ24044.1 hypothetical protein SELMODRAFT_228272 [Selaginella moellendorffii]|eukprot:XP_002974524.1 nucleoside diphosphate kinase 3 [Selaginella moellendorffii]
MRSKFFAGVARRAFGSARSTRALSLKDGRAFGSAAICKGVPQSVLSFAARATHESTASAKWLLAAAALPAAVLASAVSTVHAAEIERTFIAIKPDGVQRGLISEIISRFERKGYKLVAIKILTPTKEFAMLHYDDLKERPFFNGLCDFLSSGPVVAMVWEGQGVVKYGRKLIGATSPHNSEPGTIRGDLAISVGRNIIHGSDGPETAKNEINLWFKPEELVDYGLDSEKWLYEP